MGRRLLVALVVVLALQALVLGAAAKKASKPPTTSPAADSNVKPKPKPTPKPSTAPPSPSSAPPKKEKEPAVEESLEESVEKLGMSIEAMEQTAKCGVCEKTVEYLEKVMNHTAKDSGSSKKAKINRKLKALESLEHVCGSEDVKKGGPMYKTMCESMVEEHEDALLSYFQAGAFDPDFKDRLCESRCGWKQMLKQQVEKLKASIRPGLQESVWHVLRQNWVFLLVVACLTTAITVTITLVIQLRYLQPEPDHHQASQEAAKKSQ